MRKMPEARTLGDVRKAAIDDQTNEALKILPDVTAFKAKTVYLQQSQIKEDYREIVSPDAIA